MIGITESRIKKQASFFELSCSCQTFNKPERTCSKAPFASSNPILARLVPKHKAVFRQAFLDALQRGQPSRINRADVTKHWHQEKGSVQGLFTFHLDE